MKCRLYPEKDSRPHSLIRRVGSIYFTYQLRWTLPALILIVILQGKYRGPRVGETDAYIGSHMQYSPTHLLQQRFCQPDLLGFCIINPTESCLARSSSSRFRDTLHDRMGSRNLSSASPPAIPRLEPNLFSPFHQKCQSRSPLQDYNPRRLGVHRRRQRWGVFVRCQPSVLVAHRHCGKNKGSSRLDDRAPP
jgi:hypothetical protein